MAHLLEVYLHERLVGTLANLTSDHNLFEFTPGYVDDPQAPVLSLGFFNAERRLLPPTKAPQTRLLPFFANLLPEGHLRQYLAARAQVSAARDFPLLWLTGHDLPGAIVVRHADGLSAPPGDPDVVSPHVEQDATVLKFSLAGVQLKFSAVLENEGGLTIPAHGLGGEWIVKMPSATYSNVPENEYAMLSFAREVGIEVPEIHLIDTAAVGHLPPEVRRDLGRALRIKRFDRAGSHRIHIEDFNQIFNQYPAQKYKNVSYGNMLTGIWRVMGEAAAREFVRRLVFNVAIGNGDMHLKNWSVIYSDGRTPTLAPAYDYVSTIAYVPSDELALTIARSRAWSDVSYDHLERFARKAGVPRGIVLAEAREMSERIRTVWPRFKGTAEISKREISVIEEHMARVPLLGGATSVRRLISREAAAPPEGTQPLEIS
ncbi:MAG TPA: HipA domain-containing protein [Candidatus Acidoferrales bacterium]|nr:HipA domain-containing protein [Candidatus Acidoferrales bacterium]